MRRSLINIRRHMTSGFGRRFWPVVLVILATAALPSRAAAIRAGAAAVDVTPEKLPVLINGGFLSASADKVHDPLFARCLVLDDGTTRLAICVVDSCLMPRDLLDDAKARASKSTGIPASRMLVSATHAHSCPAAMGVLGTDADPNYPPLLTDRIAKSIEQANANLAPAKVAWGVANAGEYTGCRRWIRRPDRMLRDPFGELSVRANMHPGFQSPDAIGPSGPEDPDLTVLSVRSAEGRPVALLANFGMHYFATGVTPVSSDYYGLFAQKVARLLDADHAAQGQPPFVGIMSQGTSGDMWRVDYGKPQPKITIDEYADALATRAVEAIAKVEHRADLPLAMAQREIPVQSRGPTPERLEWAKKVVSEMNGRAPKTVPEVYAREQVYLSERPQASMLLQAIRVGDFGIAAMPNEVYALTGLKIKAQSPLRTTMNVELANDELGYIPPPEQHKLGGYTTWPARSSYCDVDAEPRMIEAVLGLLEEVSGKPRRKVVDSHGPYAHAVLESGPRAYWRMNEMTGPTARDAIGGGDDAHDATYEDGVAFYLPGPDSPAFGGERIVNRAPHFAGGRMRADLRELGGAYSVELWFWNGLPGDARPVAGYLFSRGADKADGAPGDHLGIGGTAVAADRLIFFNGNKLNTVLSGRTKVEPKTWNHVVLVRDGKRASVYLNGNPEPEIAGETDAGYPAGMGQVFVGGRNDNFANFEGKIDEVAVYPRALPADEVAQHYKTSGMHPEAAATALRPPAPLTPTESLKKLHVKDGYEVELVASEPLVMDPVAIAFGPDGKLWVAEMSDYPYGGDGKMKPVGRIRYLESTHGDGRYDKSTLFLEGVNFPTGVMPWRNGVIVTAAPEIFYAEDTDGDGKADIRRTLYAGFTQGNPQLRVNDPTWGLDNWVYIANGMSSRGKVRSEKTGAEVEMSGHDARLRPDEGLIETEAGLSEFGRNRSDWGDYFGCDNSHPMWHFVLSERYGRRNPYVALAKATNLMGLPPNGPVYALSPEGKRYHSFEHAGHYTSACSATVYRDDLLFSRGTDLEAFVCEPVHNLVQRLVLTESGPTYAAAHREDETKHDFLASEDPWCRPVFVTTGPDGALWVADMYRYMIEHPDWLPQQGRDEYRPFFRLGDDRGRIYRIFPKGRRPRAVPRLDKLGTPELVAALDSPSGWQRDTVQQLLVWANDKSAVGPLEQLASESRNPLARLHALCTLDGLNSLKPEVIERALRDEHPAVRRQAVRLAESRAKVAPHLVDAAIRLTDDPDAKVRLQLACTLGEWDGDAAGQALAKLAMSAGDNSWLAAAVMTAAPRHYSALASAALAAPDPLAVGFFRELLDMALARNDRADIAKLLGPVISPRDGHFRTEQLEAFGGLLDYLAQHKSSLQQLASEKQDALSQRLATAAALFDFARKATADAGLPPEPRTAAVALLGRGLAHVAEDLDRLGALFSPQTPTPVQRAAVAALARAGADRVPTMLLGRWSSHSPEVRTAVVDAMLGREPWAFALLQEVEAGRIRPAEFDAARRQRLLQHSSGRIKSLAQQLLGATADPSREKVIEAYRPALALAGDATRGAKVFANHCATCHRLGNLGQEVGPNLQSVSGWQAEALLTAILDPNRQVEPRYLGYTATLNDGETVFGVITAETGNGIRMKGLDGRERTLLRGSIQSLAGTTRSLMPDGLEVQISKQDLADLIRFVQSPQR